MYVRKRTEVANSLADLPARSGPGASRPAAGCETPPGLSAAEAGWEAAGMDAAGRADQLQAALRAAGAGRGAVACRAAGSGAAVRAWGLVPVSPAFEAGSVTKVVTGLLLALAIDAGEALGSDRLDRFLPGVGAAGGATLAELATHTSGLPRLPAATLLRALAHSSDPYRGTTLRRLVRDTRWVHRGSPGEAAYSNLGVALLGHALAAAAARPYWDLARSRVLAPLGMASSGNLLPSALAVPAGAWDLGAFGPAGGLRATVDDLLRLAWVAAEPGESPFPAAAAAALTPQAAMGGGHVGWCWMIRSQARGPVAWHNGATGSGWAFIGASRSSAIAACVPAHRHPAWDDAALRALAPDASAGA
jgi:serine-type D-Ala-D-Ala carboxypeptidase/endopeptidase